MSERIVTDIHANLPARLVTVAVVTEATITCPECSRASPASMPTDACQWFYRCDGCGTTLRPLPGDCCVFCSYSDQVCPPKQAGQLSC